MVLPTTRDARDAADEVRHDQPEHEEYSSRFVPGLDTPDLYAAAELARRQQRTETVLRKAREEFR